MGTHFYTSITLNFLPKARVLAQSIRKFHPAATIHLVLCDRVPSWFAMEAEPFDSLIRLEQVGAPNLNSWLFGHDQVELCTAVKGFALQSILAKEGCENVIYLDPDILVLAPLDGLLKTFEQASILVTPHQTVPETSDETVRDNELRTLQHGIYNFGFVGVKNSPEGRRFADWWAERLRDFCWDDIPKGLFTDQRWPDLIPAFFPDHKVLRDPGYNVAGWNLTHRRVEGSLEQGFTVNGEPLVFYHFSGIDSGREFAAVQRYGSDMPALFELRNWYLEECQRNGASELGSAAWAYGCFADGQPILRSQRRQYREEPNLQASYPNPFETFQNVAPAVEPDAEPNSPAPYRIFLIATPGDEVYVDETLKQLHANTAATDSVWLVAKSLERKVQSIAVDAERYEDFAAHILQNFIDKDIVLVRAGAMVPSYWDLRLAWTAARHGSAITVSPLDRRALDAAALSANLDADEVDRLCYFYRQDSAQEWPFFLRDCVYIKATGLQELARVNTGLRLTHLADDAARMRWQHLQASDICVSFRCPRETKDLPKPDKAFTDQLRRYLSAPASNLPRSINSVMVGATLHIDHTLGGGIEHWIRSFAGADAGHENLVLKSNGPALQLYRYGTGEPQLLESFALAPAIATTALTHSAYQQVLKQIKTRYRVGRVIVSSLIGHSLDCLRVDLPLVCVAHDYYPYCSAINIHFEGTCQSCEAPRLEACLEENPLNRFFPNVRSDWLALRAEFIATLKERRIPLIAPSPSVEANYARLAPELAELVRVIPHGIRSFSQQTAREAEPLTGRPLRIVVLGNMALQKGSNFLTALLPQMLTFADVTLVGCSESGEFLATNPRVKVVSTYRQEELPEILRAARADVGLLLSIWPETFSYTLHELQGMGVPPVATNLGAFADSIQEGLNGFLCEPDPLSVIACLRRIIAEPQALARVRANLQTRKQRSVPQMIADYGALLPEPLSAESYFSGPRPAALMQRALRLYWRQQEQPFLPANSFVFAPEHSRLQSARLPITPVPAGIAQLRLDLGSAPALISLFRVVLCALDGKALWSFRDTKALLEGASHQQMHAADRNTLYLSGDNPHVNLKVPQYILAELSAGGHMEVEFAWEGLEERVRDLARFIDGYAGAKAEAGDVRQQYEDLFQGLNAQLVQADAGLRGLMQERDALTARAHLSGEERAKLHKHVEEQASQISAQARQIDECDLQIEVQAQQIEELQAAIGRRDVQLEMQARQLEERTQQMDHQARQLDERDGQMKVQAQQLEERTQQMDHQARQLDERDEQMKIQAQRIAELQAAIGRRDVQLADETQRQQNLLRTLDREKAASRERDEQLAASRMQIERAGDRLREQMAELARQERLVELSQAHIRNIETNNRLLLGSLSWRITSPVRKLGGLGRKLTGRGKGV